MSDQKKNTIQRRLDMVRNSKNKFLGRLNRNSDVIEQGSKAAINEKKIL